MNIGLLNILGKWITLLTVSVMSYFNAYSENNLSTNNSLLTKNGKMVNSIEYKTVTKYNSKIPSNITNVIQEGNVGLSYTNDKTKEVTIVDNPVDEVIEKGTGAYGVYKGKLVGYGPDCKGCSGEGNLACKTESGEKFSLKTNGIYYKDSKYGDVRILAANKKFPCGTIIEVVKPDGVKFMAVVMDRIGTTMANGELMDLAYSSQEDKSVFAADGLVGNGITYNVQRWGW